MENQIIDLVNKMKGFQEEIKRLKAISAKPPRSKEKALTLDEKKKLSEAINNLSEEHLGQVVAIIRDQMPHLAQENEEEIEIDIDSLDTPTLRSLEKYIRSISVPSNKKKTKQPLSVDHRLRQAEKTEKETGKKIEDVKRELKELTNRSLNRSTNSTPNSKSSSSSSSSTKKQADSSSSSESSSDSSDSDSSSSDSESEDESTTNPLFASSVNLRNSLSRGPSSETFSQKGQIPSQSSLNDLGKILPSSSSSFEPLPPTTLTMSTIDTPSFQLEQVLDPSHSGVVPQILPAKVERKEVVLQNADLWASLTEDPEKEKSNKEGHGNGTSESLWSQFKNKDVQNKLREKEQQEKEEKLRREKEEKEEEKRKAEERKKKEQEELEVKKREEEQLAEQEQQRQRELLRQQAKLERERKAANKAINMNEQSEIMASFEGSLNQGPILDILPQLKAHSTDSLDNDKQDEK